MSQSADAIIQRYFDAMRAGPVAQQALFDLFAPQAVYIEPFSGSPRTHSGAQAIRRCFEESWAAAPPDLEVVVHRVDVDGEHAQAQWTCTSPAFPAPVRGQDAYQIRGGRIHRLEVTLAAQPE